MERKGWEGRREKRRVEKESEGLRKRSVKQIQGVEREVWKEKWSG